MGRPIAAIPIVNLVRQLVGRMETGAPQPFSAATPFASVPATGSQRSLPSLAAPRPLKIATWALAGFGPDRIDSPLTVERVAQIIHEFDVVALQQLRLTQRGFFATAFGNGWWY